MLSQVSVWPWDVEDRVWGEGYPEGRVYPPKTTNVNGLHPTGMLSCFLLNLKSRF